MASNAYPPTLDSLSVDEAARALEGLAAALGPTSISDSLERCSSSLKARTIPIRSDDEPSKAVRRLLEVFSEYMTEDAIKLTSGTAVFCIDQPICNAFASRTRTGIPYVLIYSGLVNVALYRLCISILVANANLMLQARGGDIEPARTHLKAIAFNCMALSFWFYIDGEPLPSVLETFNEAHKTQAWHGLGGALAFIVMHEIGHIELGHINIDGRPFPQIYSTLVAEDINAFKAMEFEADRFALSSMKQELRPTLISSLLMVLDLMSDLECMCLPLSASHPLVVNRISTLLDAMNLSPHDFFVSRAKAVMDIKKSFHADRLGKFPPLPPGISSRAAATLATEIFKLSLPSKAECLRAVETLKALYDGNDYVGPSVNA
jgi:hypothetical protein